jgi:hypothetical protein
MVPGIEGREYVNQYTGRPMMSPNIDVPSRRAPGGASSAHPFLPMRSLEAAGDRIWTAWRSPGRFTKNPDMVRLPDGRLLTVARPGRTP